MEKNEDFIVFPKDATEEQKEEIRWFINEHKRKKESLSVIYNPNCGCTIDQFVILDRYPMSPKIISICPECKKGCLMEISNPLTFHLPIINKDFSLEELKDLVVMDSPQKHIIEKYQRHA